VKRIAAWLLIGAALGVAAWQGAEALQQESAPPATDNVSEAPAAPAPVAPRRVEGASEQRPARPSSQVTPMAQRIAVLGLLNKRNGLSRELRLRPGQAVRVGDIIVRLRACETTAPWEPQKLTGAFVQADVHGRDDKWRRIFSGWLYKESPSLNVVQDRIYDVWPKSCEMRYPDVGPETVPAVAAGGGSSRSSAKKSGGEAAGAAPEPEPAPATPSASSNSDT
jgi:hypothetical protein